MFSLFGRGWVQKYDKYTVNILLLIFKNSSNQKAQEKQKELLDIERSPHNDKIFK